MPRRDSQDDQVEDTSLAPLKVGDRCIGPDEPPYVIAELGVNHDGSLQRGLELVDAAHDAGADAIKLQWFEAGRLLSRSARLAGYQARSGAADPLGMLKALELRGEQLEPLVERAHGHGRHAIVTIYSVDLIEQARTLPFDAYKTASPDVVNRPLIEALITTARPLFVSTGTATLDEVRRVSTWLSDHPHVLLHCVSAYPTPDECAALAGRAAMEAIDPNALGYSDHTTALDTGALAVAAGARVLEKHLTHDRRAPGPDHAVSLDPQGFRQYVTLAHRAYWMLGPPRKEPLSIEADVREASRQSLTTTRDLPADHVLTAGDLTIKRPGTGIEPGRILETVGRSLARAVEADRPLAEDDLR